MQKKPRGRPKLPKGKALSKVYGARLRPEEERLVLKAIKESGMKTSDWIRTAIVLAAKKN